MSFRAFEMLVPYHVFLNSYHKNQDHNIYDVYQRNSITSIERERLYVAEPADRRVWLYLCSDPYAEPWLPWVSAEPWAPESGLWATFLAGVCDEHLQRGSVC